MTGPRVTIALPVYNGARFLRPALEGLCGQTYRDLRILVGDNASTDATPDIVAEYAARDGRIEVVRHERNLGAAGNYNALLEAAGTEYFRWAAADDVSRPTHVERCVAVLDREPDVVLAYPKTEFIDEAGAVTAEYEDRLHLDHPRADDRFIALMQQLERCNAVFGLVRTDVLRQVRRLGAYPGSDIVLLAELALHGKFFEVPERLFARRFHEEASSSMTPDRLLAFFRPDGSGAPAMREWRHFGAHLRSVWRARIPAREKRRVVRFLLRSARRNRDKFGRELLQGMTRAAGKVLAPRSAPRD